MKEHHLDPVSLLKQKADESTSGLFTSGSGSAKKHWKKWWPRKEMHYWKFNPPPPHEENVYR